MSRPVPGRAVVVLAAGLLFLDGMLVLLAGAWTDRVGLLVFGGILVGGGFGVIWLWRRWRRALRGIADARRSLRREQEALARLLDRSQSGS